MARGCYTIRRARKAHACVFTWCRRIQPGELYLDAQMPPEHELNGTKEWWVMRYCIFHAEYEHVLCSETRAQLEAIRKKDLPEPPSTRNDPSGDAEQVPVGSPER